MDAFKQASGVEKDAGDSKAVSRPQLEALEAGRRTPGMGRSLTPDGAQQVHDQADRDRESRIDHIRARLRGEEGHASHDFTKGKLQDRARSDFDRSR